METKSPVATASFPQRRLVVNGRHLATLELNEDVTDREIVSCSLNVGKDGATICEADTDGFILLARDDVAFGNGTRPRGFEFCRMTLEGKTTLKDALDALQIHRHSALRSE